MPPDREAQVWPIICAGCADPDPSPEREADRADEQAAGFLAFAQTATRAQAIVIVIVIVSRAGEEKDDGRGAQG